MQFRRLFFVFSLLIVSSISCISETRKGGSKNVHRPEKSCSLTKYSIKLKKDRYDKHVESGENRKGIELAHSKKERDALIEQGVLIKIPASKNYIVQSMNYGSPYVHVDLAARLQELEERFRKKQEEHKISDVRFVVSSAYRTTSDQDRLRKINNSAAKGTSSHSYGASLDIPRLRGDSCKSARPLFAEVLREMQKEKKLYLCPESKTIHITAR